MKKAAKLIVHGTVQGVFYRRFCKENADELDIRGFVRNLDNGDVEIVAEGDGKAIKSYIEKIKKGPPHAQIRNVYVEEKKFSGDYFELRILRF